MPDATFRGDPYRVLGVAPDASSDQIKRRWRELAREHHPDRAAGDQPEQARLTTRMARINAAYDVLRDPVRRARHDASPGAQRSRQAGWGASERGWAGRDAREAPSGPPPPPLTRPVNARFDTSAVFRRRNATTGAGRTPLRGQGPLDRHAHQVPNDLRASTPTGPVHRRRGSERAHLPSLDESRGTVLEFGRFHGWTLGEVEAHEPTYIDWISRTITRDRDLVVRARIIAADLDERGVEREVRLPRPGFGQSVQGHEAPHEHEAPREERDAARGEREAAETSA